MDLLLTHGISTCPEILYECQYDQATSAVMIKYYSWLYMQQNSKSYTKSLNTTLQSPTQYPYYFVCQGCKLPGEDI